MTRLHKSLLTALLAATLLLPGTTAYASENSGNGTTTRPATAVDASKIKQPGTDGKISNIISKVISSMDTVDYSDESFEITITQEGKIDDDGNIIIDSGTTINENPVTIPNYTFTNVTHDSQKPGKDTTKPKDNGGDVDTAPFKKTLTGGTIDLNNFITPGVYTYIIKESARTSAQLAADAAANKTWIMDQSEYRLRVYVERGGGNVITKSITMEQIKDADGNELADPQKVDSLTFNNTVTQIGSFKLAKKVVDNSGMAADSKEYTFTMSFKKSAVDSLPAQVQYQIHHADGTTDNVQTMNSATGGTINLKKDEYVMFLNLPVGTLVTVEETKESGISDVSSVEQIYGRKDKDHNGKTKAEEVFVSTGTSDAGVTGTALTYTNTWKDVTITGVVTNIAPYISLVILVIAGLTAYTTVKRHLYR